MDFSQIETLSAQDEGRWMTIKHPHTDEDTDSRLLLAGVDSKMYRKLVFAYANRQAKSKRQEPNAEEAYKYSVKTLAECTLAADNVFWRGEEVKASDKARLIQFYEAFPKIRAQADAFMADDVNYVEAEIEKKSANGATGVSA